MLKDIKCVWEKTWKNPHYYNIVNDCINILGLESKL